jgi:uncharacterized repeat protein (TIGR01451 family)
MNLHRFLAAFLLLGVAAAAAPGQVPPPLPDCGPAPLLYLRFAGLPGAHVTFYQGTHPGRDFALPASAGFRPGYIYRVRLTAMTRHPEVVLYPTLEVRGTLKLPPRLRPADYPAPVVFSEEDVEHVLAGALLTKVVYLEHPDKAIPTPSGPDQPLETDVPAGRDPVNEARALGRPLLIVRLGLRDATPEELARQNVPGTILLPRERSLPRSAAPPQITPPCWPVYDPILGPRPPEEECLHDGGDGGRPAGLDANGNVQGLDPSDTVAAYADSRGQRRLAVSNRVCLCVPRFAVLRTETYPSGYQTTLGLGGTEAVQAHDQLRARQPVRERLQNEQPAAFRGRQRPSANLGTEGLAYRNHTEFLRANVLTTGPEDLIGTAAVHRLTAGQRARLQRQVELALRLGQASGPRGVGQVESGPLVAGQLEGVQVTATVQEVRDLTVTCEEKPELLGNPEHPLLLTKWADRQAAQVGDVVTFSLKYTNQGGRSITDVAVSDSLTGRLEYIPGSAQSDRDAVFTTQQNEAGSVILHWEIIGRLLPGQSGVVRFQARIR